MTRRLTTADPAPPPPESLRPPDRCVRCRSVIPPEQRGRVDRRTGLCPWCAYVDAQG